MAESANGNVNTSVTRALDILEFMNTCGKPMTIADICRELSLNRITCTNLVKTLIAKKYLFKNDKGMICLTGKIYIMGQVFKEGFPIIEAFNAYALDIVEKLGCVSHLVTFAGLNQGILLSQVPRSSIYSESLHLYVPLYCTGAGKVLLANQPYTITKSLVATLELTPLTCKTITDRRALTAELTKIRNNGYGVDDGEFRDELHCVSAPVFNMDGTVTTAVSLTGIKIDENMGVNDYVPYVKRLASKLSYASGYREVNLDIL